MPRKPRAPPVMAFEGKPPGPAETGLAPPHDRRGYVVHGPQERRISISSGEAPRLGSVRVPICCGHEHEHGAAAARHDPKAGMACCGEAHRQPAVNVGLRPTR